MRHIYHETLEINVRVFAASFVPFINELSKLRNIVAFTEREKEVSLATKN